MVLVLGTIGMAGGALILAVAHDQAWQIVVAVTLLGGGMSFAFASMANLVVEAVPQRQTGEATGMYAIMRTVGGALGAQACAAIVAAHPGADERFPAEAGFTIAFAVSAAAVGAAALVALLLMPGRVSSAEPA